jgi:HSP20 family protein
MSNLVSRRTYPVSPLASLLNLSRDFDRLFESPFAAISREGLQAGFSPAIEVHEDADNVTVNVELPGVDKKDVSVTIHDGVLVISGERRQEREIKEHDLFRSERLYGRFERQLGLTQPVVSEKVKAAYKDGVLTVTLPKAAEAKPKAIDIAGS